MKIVITRKTIVFALILMILICMIQLPVKAADVSLSAGKTTMTVGETTTLTSKANNCTGTLSLSTSDSSVVSIEGDTSLWLENNSSSVTIKANKPGTATITLKPVSLADSDTAVKVTTQKSITITVKEKPQAPDTSSAKLKSITVAGKTYNNPNTDITVTVDGKTDTVDISAVAVNSSAKISGTGKKELKTGTNTVAITVTGSNGAKLTYNVRIRKLVDSSQEQPNVPNTTPDATPDQTAEEPTLLRLKTLMITDTELSPNFDEETFEYSVNVTNEEKLDIIAEANDENAEIEIEGNENFIDGENEVTITLTRKNNSNEEEQNEENEEENSEPEKTVYTIHVTKTTVALSAPEEENSGEDKGFFESTKGKVTIGVAGRLLSNRSNSINCSQSKSWQRRTIT